MKPTTYTQWIRKYEEELIDAWESGFHTCGDPISERTYEDFVASAWVTFQENEL